MEKKLPVVDLVIDDLLSRLDDDFDWVKEKEKLENLLSQNAPLFREWPIKLIDDHCGDSKNFQILDYGCGTGILNVLLLLKGYARVDGVDVVEKFDRKILDNLNFHNASFELIKENSRLPFEDSSFDIITSSLVLEHVEDPDYYYSEAARVLKPGGVCFFNFPHRLKPYDSHSRTWFIHYFPEGIRRVLWDIFARQDGTYLNDYLFLKTIFTHKKIARKYFSSVEDRSYKRMKYNNIVIKKSAFNIRKIVVWLCNLKYVGNIFAKIIVKNASADLFLIK